MYATEETLLRADATDADGEVIQVEFFAYWQGATRLLATVTNAPYELKYSFVYSFGDGGPQSALIQARATDNNGVQGYSPGLQIGVTYPPPPNDAFTNRLEISGAFLTVTGNNLYATLETKDPTPGRGSVWWEWAAPTSGVFTLTAVAHDRMFAPFLGLYSGDSLAGLTPIATVTGGTSDQAYSARTPVNAMAEARYVIAVSAAAGSAGDIRLCISPPDAPGTAEFERITAEPLALSDLAGVMKLHLLFRTGAAERWRVETSTNLLTGRPSARSFFQIL